MNKEKFMIVGGGGRESAFASNLAKDTQLYAIMGHKNPSIIDCVQASNGDYLIGNPSDPKTVLDFAQQHKIDYVFVSADEPLACGVVDLLLAHNIKAVGGTQAATRIEWDKIYSIETMHKVCPEYTPFYIVVSTVAEIDHAIHTFKARSLNVVVKPQGLTGGKGVKVMPEHLHDYEAASEYARQLLIHKPNEKVLLVEKLEGIEFTVMGLTDGDNLVIAPATYDYPFRLENDLGPGTGGMGCFTDVNKALPFITEADLDTCQSIMQSVIDQLKAEKLAFNGVLNGGFFITQAGIRFMEFNGRFGDPEALNVLSILDSPFSMLIKDLYHKTLSESKIRFRKHASVVKYLVAKPYPDASESAISFSLNKAAIEAAGLTVFFASAIKTSENHYQTLKTSRVLAIVALSEDIASASTKINNAIEHYISGELEYRKDIGSKENLEKLSNTLATL